MALTKINANVIANNTIAVGNIADNSVDATKIASNSILTRHIDDNQVTTDQIAANTIATANIADNAVDGTKIASNSILTRHIDDAQITTDQILDGTIATADIADDAVTSAKIDTNIDIAGTFDVTGATTLDSTLTVASHVGIGTTSPTTFSGYVSVHHKNTAGDAIHLIESDGGIIGQTFVNDASGVVTTGARSNHPWRVTTNDTERLRVDTSGNVGIGNTNPQHPLSVHLTNGQLAMFGSNGMNSPGQYAGIGLGQVLANNTTYQKVAIVAEGRNSGSYVSNLHFLVDTAADSGSAVLSDAKLTIEGGNGNVGIGESAPHEKLHVTGASGNTLLLHMDADTAGGTNILGFKNDSTNDDRRIKAGIIFQRDDPGTRGTGDLHICVNGVNSDTNVSVSDSKMAFYASGESAITGGTFYVSGEGNAFSAGGHNGMQFAINGQSVSSRAADNLQTHKSFYNPNGSVGTIKTTGSATQFNTSSDYRLKENIVTDWDGTTLLKQLKPSKFNFKADTDTTIQGFLAHEVSSIVPQAVSGEKDAVYTAEEAADGEGVEGQPNYQGIDHSHLVPLLVKTIQELEARIATLEG